MPAFCCLPAVLWLRHNLCPYLQPGWYEVNASLSMHLYTYKQLALAEAYRDQGLWSHSAYHF